VCTWEGGSEQKLRVVADSLPEEKSLIRRAAEEKDYLLKPGNEGGKATGFLTRQGKRKKWTRGQKACCLLSRENGQVRRHARLREGGAHSLEQKNWARLTARVGEGKKIKETSR